MSASKYGFQVLGLLAGLMVFSPLTTAADVKLYDKAPSVEELQKQLTGGDTAEKPKHRTRAIVFGDADPEPQNDAQPAQAKQEGSERPASQPAPRPRPQQTQSQGQAQAQQTLQVSANAIAFPINFRVNSSEIQGESIPFLDSIAGLLQKDPGIRLLVEGHTDSSGSAARNNALARERAYSVVNYLIERYKVDPTRLMPLGKGFSEPLEGLESSNPKNRRVQFRIIG